MDARTGLPVVGMVGGGRIARMTHQAAIALGQSLRVLVPAADDCAALVAADVHVGDHTDLATLRTFAEGCDVVTFGHERVPGECIRALAADGITVLPGAGALRYTQDKLAMRERLAELGVPVSAPEEVPPGRQLAALVARSPFGQVAAYPVVQVVRRDEILVRRDEVLAPAPGLDAGLAVQAQRLAIELATALDVVGLLAVEFFETSGGVLVNEFAMRPHASGDWTIDGSRTSQFEQHLRAVLDYPLGDTSATAPAVATANVPGGGATDGMRLDERLHHLFADDPGVQVHLYGTGETIGHVTVLGEDMPAVRARAARAARWLAEGRY
jgi:5-(carboxyamino)imidazole ribonucleotide synthase